MFQRMKKILILTMMLMTTSCASLWSTNDEESLKDQSAPVASAKKTEEISDPTADTSEKNISLAKPSHSPAESEKGISADVSDQLGLSQARMSERMSEIEAELKRQREQIKLLERGLLTGIPPSELRALSSNDVNTGDASKKLVKEASYESEGDVVKTSLTAPVIDPELIGPLVDSKDVSDEKLAEQEFEAAMTRAKNLFQSGDFSKALSSFGEISRAFGDKGSAINVRFWLGKCYAGLKDYPTAKGEFEAYLAASPLGSNAAEARLDLARTLAKMGLKERARTELRRVLKDFEGQDSAEIAAYELSAMQGAL